MNEIFSNEVTRLTLNTSVRGEVVEPTALPTATLYVSSDIESFPETGTALTVSTTTTPGLYHVAVPYSAPQEKRFAKVVYSYELAGYGTINKEELYEVRTRLISFEEYVLMTGDEGDGFEAFNLAETESRLIIEAFTRQKFSKWTGERTIHANPNRIYVPQYLRELTSVQEYDEWQLSTVNDYYMRDSSGFAIYKDVDTDSRAGIKKFTITGKWGYESVPDHVKKAAYELTRDFSSSVINNRRQYLLNTGGQSLGSAMEQSTDLISWKAYTDSTGNFVADQLLMNYRVFQLGII